MLYFLYGSDKDKARAKARELIAILRKKKPGAELFRLDSDNWSSGQFDEFVGGQGLFERKFIVFANQLFGNGEAKEIILQKLPAIRQSENIFIFLETKIEKSELLKITEVAERVQTFEAGNKEKESFNIFSLANALRARDRKGLWVLYQKALRDDVAPEAISGILFWQVKDLLLKRSNHFSPAELHVLAKKLITLYHDAHRGFVDFETGLERFALCL